MGVFREDGTVFPENVAAAPVYPVDMAGCFLALR